MGFLITFGGSRCGQDSKGQSSSTRTLEWRHRLVVAVDITASFLETYQLSQEGVDRAHKDPYPPVNVSLLRK